MPVRTAPDGEELVLLDASESSLSGADPRDRAAERRLAALAPVDAAAPAAASLPVQHS
jgi:hypothetical protein